METNFRGDILICSSLTHFKGYAFINDNIIDVNRLNFGLLGHALCIAKLSDCRKMVLDDEKNACCKLYDAYSWFLEDIRKIEPYKVKGKLGLFNI